MVDSHTHMKESCHHFKIYSTNRNWNSTMDYDVFAMSIEADRNGNDQTIPYCGKMTDIVEVNFRSFHIVLAGALWYRLELSGRNATIVMDECGFFKVNIAHHHPKNRVDSDVWIYPH